jgi:hypothetical protein
MSPPDGCLFPASSVVYRFIVTHRVLRNREIRAPQEALTILIILRRDVAEYAIGDSQHSGLLPEIDAEIAAAHAQ